MGPDDGEHTGWAWVVPVEERVCRLQSCVKGGQELAMGHVTAELAPPQLNRVQPWAVRGQL